MGSGYRDTREHYGKWWLLPLGALVFVVGVVISQRLSDDDGKATSRTSTGAAASTAAPATTSPPMDSQATCQARDRFIEVTAVLTPDGDPTSILQSLEELAGVLDVLEDDGEHDELVGHVGVLRPVVEEGRGLVGEAASNEDILVLAENPAFSDPDAIAATVAIANYPLRCPPPEESSTTN